MQKDSKTIAIWVLAIALIIVGALWLGERNEPSDVKSFSEELTSRETAMREACADTSTDAKRSACINALENVKTLIGDFFPSDDDKTTATTSVKTSGNSY